MAEENRLTTEQLELAGRALFGERWKSPLARALYLGADHKNGSVRIREVMSGRRPAPSGWTEKILALLESHAKECLQVATIIKEDKKYGK